MKTRIGALAALVFAFSGTSVLAAPTTVNLRVEGASQTIFEGKVTTDGHRIEQDKAGPRACDGTVGAPAGTQAGPTVTSALDDALAWDGTYNLQFSDFLVSRIGLDANTSTSFWGEGLNYKQTQIGGCQQRVVAGDQVLFAYDLFSKKHILKLTGPSTAVSGRPFKVKVVDGQDGKPVAGAKLGRFKTNSDGVANLTVKVTGSVAAKAERSDSVRSNALIVRVKAAPKRRR